MCWPSPASLCPIFTKAKTSQATRPSFQRLRNRVSEGLSDFSEDTQLLVLRLGFEPSLSDRGASVCFLRHMEMGPELRDEENGDAG